MLNDWLNAQIESQKQKHLMSTMGAHNLPSSKASSPSAAPLLSSLPAVPLNKSSVEIVPQLKSAQKIYSTTLHELMRQVATSCYERGILLFNVWKSYEFLFDQLFAICEDRDHFARKEHTRRDTLLHDMKTLETQHRVEKQELEERIAQLERQLANASSKPQLPASSSARAPEGESLSISMATFFLCRPFLTICVYSIFVSLRFVHLFCSKVLLANHLKKSRS